MTDIRQIMKDYWLRLSRRERLLASATGVVVAALLFYQFPYTMQERSAMALRSNIAAVEKETIDIAAQMADLKSRANEIKGVTTGWQLADQKSAVLFLEDVSGEARRVGVSLVAIHPSREIDKQSHKEVSMSLDLKGRYRELASYFKRLEGLSKVVNIRRIRIESCPDSSSVCAAQIEAVAYMAK